MPLTERQKRMRQAEEALAIQSNIKQILLEIENRLLKKRIMVSQPVIFKKNNEGLYKNITNLIGDDTTLQATETKNKIRGFLLSKVAKKRKLSRVLNKFEDKTDLWETLLPLAIQDICGLSKNEIKKRFAK